MEDVIVRSRYHHRSFPVKRKKKNIYSALKQVNKEAEYEMRHCGHTKKLRKKKVPARIIKKAGTLMETMVRQALFSILLLLIILSIKSINTPVANFITDKIKWALVEDMKTDVIYQTVDDLFIKIKNIKLFSSEKSVPNEAVPVSAFATTPLSLNIATRNGYLFQNGLLQKLIAENSNTVQGGLKQVNMPIDTAASWESKYILPVAGVLSSPFGERIHPISNLNEFHKGVDIEANLGTPIKAVMDGEVIEAASDKLSGKYIKIKQDDGLTSAYAHCSLLLVKKGNKVKQGDIIAKVGNTGLSTGAHLHFEILKGSEAINPLYYIRIN